MYEITFSYSTIVDSKLFEFDFIRVEQKTRSIIIFNMKNALINNMSQETKPWVLVSSIQKETKPTDLEMITPQISSLVDEWQSQGKIMWSGAFDNQVSSMAVFEATEQEAKDFFKKYENICSGILTYEMYQWDAMPILSILSK